MKHLKLITLCLASLSLFACNMGGDSTSTDNQSINNNNSPTGVVISGNAANCMTTTTCSVNVLVSATTSGLAGARLGYTVGTSAITSVTPQCTASNNAASPTTCSFTIPTVASQSTVTLYLNTTKTGATFNII